jgi:hypothetical protein
MCVRLGRCVRLYVASVGRGDVRVQVVWLVDDAAKAPAGHAVHARLTPWPPLDAKPLPQTHEAEPGALVLPVGHAAQLVAPLAA